MVHTLTAVPWVASMVVVDDDDDDDDAHSHHRTVSDIVVAAAVLIHSGLSGSTTTPNQSHHDRGYFHSRHVHCGDDENYDLFWEINADSVLWQQDYPT